MGSVFPPPYDAMGLGNALMEVMRGTAVSFHLQYNSFHISHTDLVAIFQHSFFITCTVSCQSGAFRCSNGQCISSTDRCDGNQDCTDGSDETGCSSPTTGSSSSKC